MDFEKISCLKKRTDYERLDISKMKRSGKTDSVGSVRNFMKEYLRGKI